jgi:hypothetical protein
MPTVRRPPVAFSGIGGIGERWRLRCLAGGAVPSYPAHYERFAAAQSW